MWVKDHGILSSSLLSDEHRVMVMSLTSSDSVQIRVENLIAERPFLRDYQFCLRDSFAEQIARSLHKIASHRAF